MAGDSGNIKNPGWYGGGLSTFLKPGAGNVFYVNGGSDGPVVDTNDGLTPSTPKQLLQSGIDLCTDGNNDTVVVLNYGGNARAVETFPVDADKYLMHIVGVGTLGQKWPVVSVSDPGAGNTANPGLLISADRVEVANLIFGGGTTAGAIHVGGGDGTWGAYIHDCYFGVGDDNAVGQDGIRIITGAAPYLTLVGCRFGHQLTRDGLRFDANATRCMIGIPGQPSNYFHNVPGIAINMSVGAVTEPGIFDNRFALAANTAGGAISFHAGVLDAMIDGNSAYFGDTTMGNNPYSDAAGAGANAWGLNYQSDGAVMPT